MLRRILTIVLAVAGVVVIVLAIASATVWRPSDSVTAALPAPPDAPLVVTDAGVLDMVGDDVSVRATAADGAPVILVIGREPDVAAWVGDAAHVQVTGLASWTELATTAVEGEASVPTPAGSDMWVTEVAGTGGAEVEWPATEGRWSLLAATDGTAAAPQLDLTWPRQVATPLLVPGLIVGGVLLLAALVIGLTGRRGARTGASPAAEGGKV